MHNPDIRLHQQQLIGTQIVQDNQGRMRAFNRVARKVREGGERANPRKLFLLVVLVQQSLN
jgi:hypothetical protein